MFFNMDYKDVQMSSCVFVYKLPVIVKFLYGTQSRLKGYPRLRCWSVQACAGPVSLGHDLAPVSVGSWGGC